MTTMTLEVFLESNNLTNLKGHQLTSSTGNIYLSIHHHLKRDLVIIIK